MTHAIAAFPGAIVVFASSLRPDMEPLRMMLETVGSCAIVIEENDESAEAYHSRGFHGVVFRNATGTALVECLRGIASGKLGFRRNW